MTIFIILCLKPASGQVFNPPYESLQPDARKLRRACQALYGVLRRHCHGTVAVQYGDKVWYLYGASSNNYRNLMPNYLLQWRMIEWAIENNCRIYDFRGISGDLSENNPLFGLYRFKKGFGGELVEFAGEFEYNMKPVINWMAGKGEKAFRGL